MFFLQICRKTPWTKRSKLSSKRPTPSLLNLKWKALPSRLVSNNVFRPILAAFRRLTVNFQAILSIQGLLQLQPETQVKAKFQTIHIIAIHLTTSLAPECLQ